MLPIQVLQVMNDHKGIVKLWVAVNNWSGLLHKYLLRIY